MDTPDIKTLLDMSGISIGQIAKAAEVNRSTASRVISGAARSRRVASIVAELLGKELDALWPGKYPETYRRNRSNDALLRLQAIAANYPREAA